MPAVAGAVRRFSVEKEFERAQLDVVLFFWSGIRRWLFISCVDGWEEGAEGRKDEPELGDAQNDVFPDSDGERRESEGVAGGIHDFGDSESRVPVLRFLLLLLLRRLRLRLDLLLARFPSPSHLPRSTDDLFSRWILQSTFLRLFILFIIHFIPPSKRSQKPINVPFSPCRINHEDCRLTKADGVELREDQVVPEPDVSPESELASFRGNEGTGTYPNLRWVSTNDRATVEVFVCPAWRLLTRFSMSVLYD